MIRRCLNCNKKFKVDRYRLKDKQRGKYCSRKCFYQYSGINKIQRKCIHCGKLFKVSKSKLKYNKSNFCSKNCHYRHRSKKIKLICIICGKEFARKPSALKNNRGRFCNASCKSIWVKKYCVKSKDTDIERLIEEELKIAKIPFLKQCPIEGIALVDFLLPNKIIIQADGIYWHSLQKQKIRDANQDFVLNFKGYKIYRFTGIEIKKSANKCIQKILEGGLL